MNSPRITNRSRRYTIPEDLLLLNTPLLDYFMEDVIFVSVDFEGEDNYFDEPGIVRPVSVGTSVLDTRDLDAKRSDIISTENLCFMAQRQFKETDRHFLFGSSQLLPFGTTKDTLRLRLSSLLSQQYPENSDNQRRIILVTFDGRGEACIMEHLGVRFGDCPGLVGILDVQAEIARILGMPLGKRLDQLWSFTEALNFCKVSYGNLHVGGNDSYFNLQLLLSLISIECAQRKPPLTVAEQHKLAIIQYLTANALQVDRDIAPATFEYKGDIRWRSKDFRRRAYQGITSSLPEVQEARQKKRLEETESNIALKAALKENNKEWHDNFEGIQGLSEVFNGFDSE